MTGVASPLFSPRGSRQEIEEGQIFAPKFDAGGLIACVVTDAGTGGLLMVAHMNAQALERTIATGEAWFYSRSRGRLWKKGETSGHVMHVAEIRVDCDQDVLWLRVEQAGPGACHTGRRSCFYRTVVRNGPNAPLTLAFHDDERVFDPAKAYGR
ncbi:MAG TPA: phosphoribosyl-AMP cyclohydrolase [Xanthobacteraceae bacterium]|nr:phosphoribosyl-AMP cyclohydrolase [Xanthobacteraceae bacterium]